MFCVQCGGEVPAGSRFCPRCGRAAPSTGDEATPTGGPPSAPAPGPPLMPPPPPPTSGSGPPPSGSGPPPSGYGPPPGTYPPPPPGVYPPPPPGAFSAPGATGGPVAYGLASFGQRVGAFVIDMFITWSVFIVGFIGAGITTPTATFDNPDPSPSGPGILVMLISWVVAFAYPIVFEGRPESATLGKKAVQIRVVRQSNGAPLGYGLALGRFLARIADSFTFGLGLLWAAWDPLHQTFHDKIAGTLVVRSSVYPPPGATPAGGPPRYQPPPPNPYQAG